MYVSPKSIWAQALWLENECFLPLCISPLKQITVKKREILINTTFFCLSSAVSRRLAEFDGRCSRHAGRSRENSTDPDGERSRLRDQTGSCKDVMSHKYNPT